MNSKNTKHTYHYIYRTESEKSKKFYIGRHSTHNLLDNYKGSGVWVSRAKKKEKLKVTILEFSETLEELCEREVRIIEENINNPLCMNLSNSSTGAAFGELNPAKRSEIRKKRSETNKRLWKSGVFSKRGPHTEETKKKIREKRKHQITSLETKRKISSSLTGLTRTQESKLIMSEKAKERQMVWYKNPNSRECVLTSKKEEELYISMGWIRGKYQKDAIYVNPDNQISIHHLSSVL